MCESERVGDSPKQGKWNKNGKMVQDAVPLGGRCRQGQTRAAFPLLHQSLAAARGKYFQPGHPRVQEHTFWK